MPEKLLEFIRFDHCLATILAAGPALLDRSARRSCRSLRPLAEHNNTDARGKILIIGLHITSESSATRLYS